MMNTSLINLFLSSFDACLLVTYKWHKIDIDT